MRSRVIILVLLAFVAALGTVYFARNWLEAQRADFAAYPGVVPETRHRYR